MRRLAVIAAALATAPLAAAPDRAALIDGAIDRGRFVQAAEMIALIPDRAERESLPIRLAQARLHLAQYQPLEALNLYQRILATHAGNCDALEGAGLAALRSDRSDAARSTLAQATAACPARWRPWNGLGVIADRQRRWPDSAAAYAQALRIAPGESAIVNNIAYSLMLQGRFDEAEPRLKQALKMRPGDERLLNNLDLATVGAGHPLPDIAAADDHRDPAARLNNAGYVSLLLGRTSAAADYLEQALKRSAVHYPRAEANLDLARNRSEAR